MPSPDPDVEAMLRLQGGDDRALNDLMDRWRHPLANYIFRLVGNEQDAVDLAQQTFVQVYKNRSRYRPTGKFSSWLFTIATHLSRNHLRWCQRHPTVSIQEAEEKGDPSLAHLPSDTITPSDQTLSNELSDAVRNAIHALPEDLKTVVVLFEYQELSYHEIAEILTCTPKAVETRLYRAKKILREKLGKFLAII